MKFIFEKDYGLYIESPNPDVSEHIFISEFEPYIVKKIHHCNMQTLKKTDEFLVAVKNLSGETGSPVSLDSLHNISYFKTFNCPDSMLTSKQRSILEYKLQQEASQIETETHFIYPPGLYKDVNGSRIFTLGNRIYYANTQRSKRSANQESFSLIPFSSVIDDKSLCDTAKDFINFFPGVSEILFYGSLFGIVKPFLAELNLSPDFIIAVIGKSGSLKTSLVRKYALWLETPEKQEENFQSYSHMSDILSQIDNMQGLNFLMDDLHNVHGTQAKNRQNDRLDKLVRHICTNPQCANVIITGENMKNMSIFSAYDRIFQITLPPISADRLQAMKENMNGRLLNSLMAQIAELFAKKLMENYNKVLDNIQMFFKRYKPFGFENSTVRTGRHIMFLRLTEFLYRTYVCDQKDNLSCKKAFEVSLQVNADYQQKLLIYQRKTESDINYVKSIYECLNANDKYIHVCTSPHAYTPSDNTCLIEKANLFITSTALSVSLSKYLNMPVSAKKAALSLRDAGLLDTGTDTLTKKKLGRRHYKINYTLLENAYKMIPDIY